MHVAIRIMYGRTDQALKISRNKATMGASQPCPIRFLVTVLITSFLSDATAHALGPPGTSCRGNRNASAPFFLDVTMQSDITNASNPLWQFGGPVVADIDDDGRPDIILTHHHSPPTVHFNNGNGTFSMLAEPFLGPDGLPLKLDFHGLTVAPVGTDTRDRYILITTGGSKGTKFSYPHLYRFTPWRTFTRVSESRKLQAAMGRNRAPMFMCLTRQYQHPDIVLSNFDTGRDVPLIYFLNMRPGAFAPVLRAKGMADDTSWMLHATDVDGDRRMEIINAYNVMRIYKQTDDFTVVDASASYLPSHLMPPSARRAIQAVAEIDFDNDGDFDLFLARSRSKRGTWKTPTNTTGEFSDILLENVGGRYIDVSARAGLNDVATRSIGVSVSDVDNDGFPDIVLVQLDTPEVILFGHGDGTFRRESSGITLSDSIYANNVVASDVDEDGWVDLVVAHGSENRRAMHAGQYFLYRNILSSQAPINKRRWLHVRVRTAPTGRATSLHAVVKVKVGRHMLTRRVGSVGEAYSASFLDTVHFGCGCVKKVAKVMVTWQNGETAIKRNVKTNQRISMGVNFVKGS